MAQNDKWWFDILINLFKCILPLNHLGDPFSLDSIESFEIYILIDNCKKLLINFVIDTEMLDGSVIKVISFSGSHILINLYENFEILYEQMSHISICIKHQQQ
jgi:hypothetical protein